MLSRRHFTLAIMLTATGMTAAAQVPLSVVLVQYVVSERSAERVERMVSSPLERALVTLERVAEIRSTTSHGTVDIEIHFEGGATEHDLAAVMNRIAPLAFGSDIRVSSVSLHLRAPRFGPAG